MEVFVQGEGHVLPGLWLDPIALPGDLPLAVGVDDLVAVGAVEEGFKGGLRPVLPHHGVHGVAPVPVVLPLVRGHLPHPTNDVRGQVAAPLTGDGGPNGHPGQILGADPDQKFGSGGGNVPRPGPVHPLLPAEDFQPLKVGFGAVPRDLNDPGDHVLSQNFPVAVQELSPSGGNGLGPGDGLLGSFIVSRPVDHLEIPQQGGKTEQQTEKQACCGVKTKICHVDLLLGQKG